MLTLRDVHLMFRLKNCFPKSSTSNLFQQKMYGIIRVEDHAKCSRIVFGGTSVMILLFRLETTRERD